METLPLTDSEKGGLRNRFGVCYQELHSLQLIRQVLAGELDGFYCERGEDYLGYSLKKDGRPSKLNLVQVKSSSSDCVLCKRKQVIKDAIENLTRSFRRFHNLYPETEITLSLVLSSSSRCEHNHQISASTHLMAVENEKLILKSYTEECPAIEIVFGPPCPPTFEEICEQLRGVAEPLLDLERLFVSSGDRTIFLKLLAGIVIPVIQPNRSEEQEKMPEVRAVDAGPLFRNSLHRDETSIRRDITQLLALANVRADLPNRYLLKQITQLHEGWFQPPRFSESELLTT